jgi:intracellular multiplication protein IcmL
VPEQQPIKRPTAGPPPGALEAVVTRNAFYRDGYRFWMKVAFIQSLALVGVLIALTLTIATSKPEDRFFATTADGRLIRMTPLNESNMNDAAIISWASRAASDIMTFGFHDYQRRLQENANYFTRRGWQTFSEALEKSRITETVEKSQQVVSAVVNGAPTITQQGLTNGIYRWIIQLPLVVTYQSGSATQTEKLSLTLTIVRTSTLDNPSGVGIQQWIGR